MQRAAAQAHLVSKPDSAACATCRQIKQLHARCAVSVTCDIFLFLFYSPFLSFPVFVSPRFCYSPFLLFPFFAND